jgi:hypothetical protein
MSQPSSDPKLIDAIARRAQALDAKLCIAERRAKLNGLMPVRADMTITEVTADDLEASALIREAKAKVAAEEAREARERRLSNTAPSPVVTISGGPYTPSVSPNSVSGSPCLFADDAVAIPVLVPVVLVVNPGAVGAIPSGLGRSTGVEARICAGWSCWGTGLHHWSRRLGG